MLAIIGTIFGHIGAGLVSAFGNSVLAPILNTVQNGQNANRDVAVSTLSAEVAANNARTIIAPSFKGLIYCIGLPAAAHFGAICLDSMPWRIPYLLDEWHVVGSWKVAPLPGGYLAIEGTILTAFFISSPLTTLAKAGAAALIKR
ncbi:hypothetical protein SB2_06695 [Methylobacterium radiotolerans]|uniref:hypothetical protein n=1 Tax=Methylobacterium sp. B1 TaxID=91459 RepID=UPI00034CADEB|nr:hypothetical protein [Methylobacterium sp. B1]KTS10238.1 hypothetical protein SB3_08740 [Methylobacterium radiotolerans]KTS49243.1 hypothetical protein SB2_06695 [Methylobacterium radiotolerans]